MIITNKFSRKFVELKDFDFLQPKIVTNWQLQEFKKIVSYARASSAWYKELFKRKVPLSIKSLKDIESIPFTTAEDFKNNNAKFLAGNRAEIANIFSSSGTTGTPKLVFYGRSAISRTNLQYAYMFRRANIEYQKAQEVAGIFFPLSGLTAAGPRAVRAMEYLQIPAIGFGLDTDPVFAASVMKQFSPTVLFVFPSMFLMWTHELKEKGINPKIFKVKKIFSAGEPLSDNTRLYLEENWSAKVFNLIANVELGFIGSECAEHNGLHLFQQMAYTEVLDLNTMKNIRDGTGELVLTGLCNYSNPLIRYRTHDVVRISYERCPCGRYTPRIWSQGRTDDRIILAGAIKFYPTQQIEEVLKEIPQVTTFWQLIISTQEKQDVIKIKIEAEQNAFGKKFERKISEKLVANSTDLYEGIHTDSLILQPEVELVPMGSLERKRGKIKDKIIDQRKTRI